MRKRDIKIEKLSQVPLFSRCSDRELAHLASIADEVHLEPGTTLCRQGSFGRECFFLVEGEADAFVNDRWVASLGPGATIGEMALLDREPRSATVVTTTSARAYVIDASRFTALIDEIPSITRAILSEMSNRIRKLDGWKVAHGVGT
jgi:CRP/FNR family transcriptional regulator, cyclic AMP receptor protein